MTLSEAIEDAREEGANFVLDTLCQALGLSKQDVCWDAATETWSGDAASILHGMLRTAGVINAETGVLATTRLAEAEAEIAHLNAKIAARPLQIGDRVEVTDTFPFPEWKSTPLWVVGMVHERGDRGINVTVMEAETETWPPQRRGAGAATLSYTDGFYINRPDGADDLRRVETTAPAPVPACLEAENARLRTALTYYAETFCEGGSDFEGCGKLSERDCSGCKAKAALEKK